MMQDIISMDGQAGDLLFGDSLHTPDKPRQPTHDTRWKIMVIDDDEAVHTVSKLVLDDFTFMDRGIEVIHGYSGAEARELMVKHPDVAVILLDVVMENDHAGFEVVKYIREELKNKCVQIILRTGQPGLAPEAAVVRDYEINAYEDKSTLTTAALNTALITSLRIYRDMKEIQQVVVSDQSLLSLRAQMLNIVNNSSAVVYIKDREGRYVLVNAHFEYLFNVKCDEAVGKTDAELFSAAIAAQVSQDDKTVVAENEPVQFEESISVDGEQHFYITIKFPLLGIQRVPFGLCCISTPLAQWNK